VTLRAAGTLFYSIRTNRVLMQLRSSNCSYPLTWSLWGGKSENNERPVETLLREIGEEMGEIPDILKIYPLHKYSSRDGSFEYNSFCCVVEDEFIPSLNIESAGYSWVEPNIWPRPLHNGAKGFLLSKTFKGKLNALISHVGQNICLPK
jgi:8-oxo-dGTP pyrophosphatase MutT (NUDIX family)